MNGYLLMVPGAILVNSIVAIRIPGICPFMGSAGADQYR